MFGDMEVRCATVDDLDAVEEVARWSCDEALGEMVPAFVVDEEMAFRFRRSLLAEHVLNRHLVLGVDGDGHLEVVVLVDDQPDYAKLTTVVVPTRPSFVPEATAFVAGLRSMGWTGPLVSDTALGYTDLERFHEDAGFAPGEIVVERVGDYEVFRRRWWLGPALSAAG